MEHNGIFSEASAIQTFPPAMIGAMIETNPISEESCGATTATTPVGSGTEKLK